MSEWCIHLHALTRGGIGLNNILTLLSPGASGVMEANCSHHLFNPH